jgi:dCMP deaminase
VPVEFARSDNKRVLTVITEKKLNYYHTRALATASASPDTSTKVGALLIHSESGAVICEGYNGFIRGADDESLPMTRPEKYDYIIHAETNLLCNAVRHGISTNNCALYCTISPCIKCMRMLYQAGIKEVYVRGFYSDFEKCSNMMDLTLDVTPIGDFSKITVTPRKKNGN